jgi:hypothetical protein
MGRPGGSTVALLVLSVGVLMFSAGLALPLLLDSPDPPKVRVITIKDADERKPPERRRGHRKGDRRREQRRPDGPPNAPAPAPAPAPLPPPPPEPPSRRPLSQPRPPAPAPPRVPAQPPAPAPSDDDRVEAEGSDDD